MPVVKFDRIVSCSSEDPSHPATNLLQRKDSNRKWRSKLPGEEYISVIIQLSQPYCITAIDIGNEGSAFVEVLVGRTSAPDDFQVLLLMSSFMTPMDSRSETNKNRVRIFSKEQLSESVWKEKWDRVKVVCTQPFNKHHQYGLSFLVLHSSDGKQENSTQEISPAKALGRFALKNDEDSEINVGSFFSRRKDLQASPAPPLVSLTGAAAVRDASSPANLVDKKAPKKRKGSEDMTDTQRKKKQGEPKPNVELGRPTWSNKDESQPNGTVKRGKKPEDNLNKADVSYSSTLKTDMDGRNTINDKLKASIGDKNSHSDSSHGILQHRETERMKNLTNQLPMTYKPFNKLLDGVEIVISGYQNPGRSHVRDKALAMGAKYQQNWCSSSTHLICAFPNTPKLQEAKGKGIIVTRDWIDDCYKERKKLAWRRYATEVSERKTVNSEQESEVWELIPGMNLSHVAGRRNDVATLDTRVGSDSEDSEDEIKRIKANQCLQIRKNTEDKILRTSDKRDNAMPALKKTPVKRTEEAYDCSTDVDSEEEARDRLSIWADAEKGSYKVNLPSLPDLFNNKLFHLSQELPAGERQSLLRYITAYGGKIVKSFDEPSNYIICIKKQNLLMGTETICATPEWIWECIDSQILVSPCLYKLV